MFSSGFTAKMYEFPRSGAILMSPLAPNATPEQLKAERVGRLSSMAGRESRENRVVDHRSRSDIIGFSPSFIPIAIPGSHWGAEEPDMLQFSTPPNEAQTGASTVFIFVSKLAITTSLRPAPSTA